MSITTHTRAAILIGTAMFAVAGSQPAFASDPRANEARIDAVRSGKTMLADDQRVCVKAEVTGSRIPRKSCDTMKGWKAQGIDPFAMHAQ